MTGDASRMMDRCLETEWLDELPAADPGALGSRRDLDRLNAWMGNVRTVARELPQLLKNGHPPRLAELGAGDGRFMCRVAERLKTEVPSGTMLLLDRRSTAPPEVTRILSGLGWDLDLRAGDVFDWLEQPFVRSWDILIANLFLHHFSEAELVRLFADAAQRTRAFIAVEPRRSAFALAFSKRLQFFGCNHVTRHDAPISVRAGFRGRELSSLWPATAGWRLREARTGFFSHLFIAERRPVVLSPAPSSPI